MTHDPAHAHSHHHRGGHSHGGHSHGRHGHSQGGHSHGGSVRRALISAVVLTMAFMGIEAAVGFWSGSLALLADSGHMLADSGALGLALVANVIAARPRNERSTYGYRRAEVLAAFVNGMALTAIAALLVKEAIDRYLHPIPIHGAAMLTTALVGLLVNLLVAFILMKGQRENVNVRAAFAHVLTDTMGSVGAILAGVAVLYLGWLRADPILSLLIAVLVAWSGWRVLRETTGTLLEAAPPHLDVTAIERSIRECQGVAGVHDLHVWRIGEAFDSLTAHVTLAPGEHGTEVARRVVECLHSRFGIEHVTIQPEAPAPKDVVHLRTSRDGDPIRRVR